MKKTLCESIYINHREDFAQFDMVHLVCLCSTSMSCPGMPLLDAWPSSRCDALLAISAALLASYFSPICVAGRPWLLAVEDPQEPGTCIGSGSYAIARVQKRFRGAGTALRAALERGNPVVRQGSAASNPADPARLPDAEAAAWQAVQADGASRSPGTQGASPKRQRSLLEVVLDIGAALGRGTRVEDPSAHPERQRALLAGAQPAARPPKRPPSGPPMQRRNPKKRRPAPGPEVDEEGPAAPPAKRRKKSKR